MGELRDKVEGEAKDTGGKLAGDKKMEWEGKGQKAKGAVEGAARKMRDGEPLEGEATEGDKNL
ncbi:MAG TPA: CsbD family protein [Candidatus Dormibacteraeota bacterium]